MTYFQDMNIEEKKSLQELIMISLGEPKFSQASLFNDRQGSLNPENQMCIIPSKDYNSQSKRNIKEQPKFEHGNSEAGFELK